MTASQLCRLSDDNQSDLFEKQCHNLRTIFRTHPCIYGFVFITVVTFDITELVNDWLLFKDISTIQQGLVYGSLNPILVLLVLVVCILGTLLFMFEIINLIVDFVSGKPWVDRELVSCLIVWLQQIPMVLTNILVALCHDEPVSYFQLTKMLLVCASAILRILIPFLRTYINKKKYSGNERFRNYIYKVVTTVGLCALVCGSVTFFLFSHIVGTDENRFKVRLPEQLWERDSVKEKYFTDTGIYFQYYKFKGLKKHKYWIKLTDIFEVYYSQSVFVTLFLIKHDDIIQGIVLRSFNSKRLLSHSCYTLMLPEKNNGLPYYNNTTCATTMKKENFHEKINFKFMFIHAHAHLILGDILYNTVFLQDNKCVNIQSNDTGILLTKEGEKDKLFGEILYLKQGRDIEETADTDDHDDNDSSSKKDLGESSQLLFGADIFWRTGLFGCQCTGKKGPSINTTLRLLC